ncbi:MAG TPA: hypothetical protein VMV43_07325 [Candidatus Nanopelagicaceae bacterium]|nr:hypothetical protein [Candidatus Nanopelagicaceae bacterium]
MNGIWDVKADVIKKGDNLRDVSSLIDKTLKDEMGFIHYFFSKVNFNNPWYTIPEDDFKLFETFIEGGSRAYPSDGSIPCDIVASETRKVLKKIELCSQDPNHHYCEDARLVLKNGKFSSVRGTLKLYLGKYTTRDWRRKRFTDDIDFWMFQTNLLDSSLKECSFVKKKETGEWEKTVEWNKFETKENRRETLFAANNLNQLLDFGAGSYLEGSSLKEIFDKKIKRGHDVDLSDIINVAMVNNGVDGIHEDEWIDAWNSFEQAANTRNTRTTSNLISICRYSFAIADYLEKVGEAIRKYKGLIFDKSKYPDEKIKSLCRISTHWEKFYDANGVDETRKMIHDFFDEQAEEKPLHAQNLTLFAKNILKLLNSKYEYLKVIFEIEH